MAIQSSGAISFADINTEFIQLHLDSFANTRGYDSIMVARTYVTSSVPKFAAEG